MQAIDYSAYLCFAKQDLQTVKELGQWTGQTESHDSLHHHSQLDTQTGLHIRPKLHNYILQQEAYFEQEMTYFVYRFKNQQMPALSSQFYFSSIILCHIINIFSDIISLVKKII